MDMNEPESLEGAYTDMREDLLKDYGNISS